MVRSFSGLPLLLLELISSDALFTRQGLDLVLVLFMGKFATNLD